MSDLPTDTSQPNARPLRVLHLEDSDADQMLVAAQLRRGGLKCDIEWVQTAEAFQRALSGDWDLILSDYHLPGYSGLEALEHVRQAGVLVPFILLSGQIGEDTAVDAMRRGATDYLLKDKMARLVPAIERALQTVQAQRERQLAQAALAESQKRLTELTHHLQDSVERERASIAREIHDDVGGSLTAVKFDLAWIARHCEDAAVVARAHQAQETLDLALGASQRLMLNLRPAVLDQGLVPALQWLVRSFADRTGIECQLFADPDSAAVAAVPNDIALVAFRAVQESLTNVSKHAQATRVTVDLVVTRETLSLEVCDNGKGWPPGTLERTGRFGLRGLRERAQAVRGWLDLDSGPAGTIVLLSVPLVAEAERPHPEGAEPA